MFLDAFLKKKFGPNLGDTPTHHPRVGGRGSGEGRIWVSFRDGVGVGVGEGGYVFRFIISVACEGGGVVYTHTHTHTHYRLD